MSRASYTHKFVKAFPEQLDDGVLYVSVEFKTAAHRCFCGCGSEVYTRFSPTDWSMKFDGEAVSINPSIGNWSFACQSHYILANGRVHWADKWSRERIDLGRALDRERKERQFKGEPQPAPKPVKPSTPTASQGLLARFALWLAGK
jgi:hypothetical protein